MAEEVKQDSAAVDLEQGIKRLEQQTGYRDELAKALGITPEDNEMFSIPQMCKKTAFNHKTAVPFLQNLLSFGLLTIVRNSVKKREDYKLVFDKEEIIANIRVNAEAHGNNAKAYTDLQKRFESLAEHLATEEG